MEPTKKKAFGHSADVRIFLHLNGATLPVAQLGPDFLVLKVPIDHPPVEAEISMSIDGDETSWPVRLAEGISPTRRRTKITSPVINGAENE